MYLYAPGASTRDGGPFDDPLGIVALSRSDGTELNLTSDGTGTWLLTGAAGLLHDTPDVRVLEQDTPGGHGLWTRGPVLYGARDFDLTGRCVLDSPRDAAAAEDHLKRWLTPEPRTVWARRPGWASARRCTARMRGPVTWLPADPEDEDPWPRFVIPMRAADPRLYAPAETDLLASMPLGAHTSVITLPDPGSFPGVPWRVSFTGGAVEPTVRVTGTPVAFSLPGYTVPAGETVVFDTAAQTVTVTGGSVLGHLQGALGDLSPNAYQVEVSKADGPATDVRVRYSQAWL